MKFTCQTFLLYIFSRDETNQNPGETADGVNSVSKWVWETGCSLLGFGDLQRATHIHPSGPRDWFAQLPGELTSDGCVRIWKLPLTDKSHLAQSMSWSGDIQWLRDVGNITLVSFASVVDNSEWPSRLLWGLVEISLATTLKSNFSLCPILLPLFLLGVVPESSLW